MPTRIDHLVIGAANLAQGAAYVKTQLGVEIPIGGTHEKLGTHNHLMQLGNELFLEVIAVNPNGQTPARPRWFGLDDPHVSHALNNQPALLTWVVNTQDIEALLNKTSASFGKVTPISRGDLNWLFGLPGDGRLLAGGMLPYVMQWQTDTHPANRMADRGCRLQQLHIHHPYPDWLDTNLKAIGAAELVQIHPLDNATTPYLEAVIATPGGEKILRSR
ncbi:VOC family protein [Sedimenticola sp.]|uniref:VOC family protein n=1 Tax=Sedimenticola sp. TaxID=1940285 RepID=UPI003D0BD56B